MARLDIDLCVELTPSGFQVSCHEVRANSVYKLCDDYETDDYADAMRYAAILAIELDTIVIDAAH